MLKTIYSQYAHTNIHFYLELLVKYMKSLRESPVHTLEDIEVLMKVIDLFQMIKDEEDSNDLT